MAYSYVRYTGNGETRNYTFPFPYLSADHIKVRLDDDLTTNFTFLTSASVQFDTAPGDGAIIEIRRETPKDEPIVNFTDGSVLLERDLDLISTFDLYIAQETSDLAGDVISLSSDNRYDARSKRIKNVAAPVDNDEAVNKGTLVYEYPAVQVVAAAVGDLNIVATDLGVATSAVNDLGSITDASLSAPGGSSKIVVVADNIADVNLAADNMAAIQAAPANASAAAASASQAAASATAAAGLLTNFNGAIIAPGTVTLDKLTSILDLGVLP